MSIKLNHFIKYDLVIKIVCFGKEVKIWYNQMTENYKGKILKLFQLHIVQVNTDAFVWSMKDSRKWNIVNNLVFVKKIPKIVFSGNNTRIFLEKI